MADLVLLDMNPLEDISLTLKINAIVLGGKFYPLVSIRAQALKTPRSDNEKRRSNALSVKRVMWRIENRSQLVSAPHKFHRYINPQCRGPKEIPTL